MGGDALWYEAAQVVGITNALNVVADGLGGVLPPSSRTRRCPRSGRCSPTCATFYEMPPAARSRLPFALAAYEPGYLADLWVTVRHTFADRQLSRRLKEALAFAVSLTSRSAFGTGFHLAEMRRLGRDRPRGHGGRRRDPDVLVVHEDRRHAAARARHGRHRAGRLTPAPGGRAGHAHAAGKATDPWRARPPRAAARRPACRANAAAGARGEALRRRGGRRHGR